VGWCFKFNPAIATRAPYFSGLFLDLIQQPLMRALQKNINVSVASRMIIGQVGTLKDPQSKVKDQFAINPETLGKFMALIKAAIGDSLKVASAPLENMQKIEFSESNEVYNSFLKTALATGASNSNLIFPLDTRANTIESQLALNNDEFLMASLYPQYQNFLNYQINKRTSKFKFKVHLEGTQYYNNRDQRLEKQMTLLGNGIVMPGKIAAAIGMSPFEFQRNLEESQALGWTDKLTPITPAAQMSGDSKKGRPSKSDSELSDSGAQTRGDGGNIAKGGKR
jgi:hypothetical protein